jgi:ABC-type phosphate transport system substrate-binding protein
MALSKLMKIKTITSSLLALTLLIPSISFAEIVVIANPQLPVSSLTQEEVYRIYLGKTKFLPNGIKVIPVDQQVGSPARFKFYSDVIKKSDTEIKSYWSRVIFTGQGYPPIQETDDKGVKELVAKNPNCLGYVDKSEVDNTVKIIFTAP